MGFDINIGLIYKSIHQCIKDGRFNEAFEGMRCLNELGITYRFLDEQGNVLLESHAKNQE